MERINNILNNKYSNISIRNIPLRGIHTSCVLYSDQNITVVRTENERLILEDVSISNLQLVKYETNISNENLVDSSISSTKEAFPWFLDEEGNNISWDSPIGAFDGVKLISQYLQKRYGMIENIISEVKISELLEKFKDNKEITVYELYSHVSKLYKLDMDSFKTKLVENLTSNETINISEGYNNSKPLGKFGDLSLNEIATYLKDLNWEGVIHKTEFTINALPATVNLISYGLILKIYMKHIYNRPFADGITSIERLRQQRIRTRDLSIFALVGVPFCLVALRATAVSFKDVINIKIPSSNIQNNALLVLLSNLNKKIPDWLKIVLRLQLLLILVLKLLDIGILEFLNNIFYLKIYCYSAITLAIIDKLINLYLLHKFSNQNIKISEVLPNFIIGWLEDIKALSSTKANINEFKKGCYLNLGIYIVFIILLILL